MATQPQLTEDVRRSTDPVALGRAIRARRRALGLTLSELGAQCGLSVTFLSFLERGKTTASLGSLAAISESLGVSTNYFVAAPPAASRHTRAKNRERFAVGERTYERVTADFPGRQVNGVVVHLPPGHRSETLASGGERFVYMLSGSIVVTLDGEDIRLAKGDSLHFPDIRPHSVANPGRRPASFLWVGTVPLF